MWRMETVFWLVVWTRNQSAQDVMCVLNDATEFRFAELIFGWF